MKNILITILTFLTLTTAVNAACPELQVFIDKGTEMITTTMSCNGTEAIRTDLEMLAQSTGLCTTTTLAPNGFICEIVAEVAGEKLDLQTPVEWKCDDEVTKDITKMIIYEACELAMKVIANNTVDIE